MRRIQQKTLASSLSHKQNNYKKKYIPIQIIKIPILINKKKDSYSNKESFDTLSKSLSIHV